VIEAITESTATYAVGWALVSFAWQGTAVAVVTAVLLGALSKSDARFRYTVACLAMIVMIGLPVGTAMTTIAETEAISTRSSLASGQSPESMIVPTLSEPREERTADQPADSTSGSGPVEAGGIASTGLWTGSFDVERWLPAVALVWFAGVLALTARLAGGWILVERIRRTGHPVGRQVAEILAGVSRRLGERRAVRALESTLVEVPTAIGWLRPVILLPASALAGLSAAELEAILAHEIAHVRRRDYLVNLLQTVAETVLFYHPAVWWLSGRIRAEREHCADDLAVAACGDRVLYARALAGLDAMKPAAGLGIGATGGSLVGRVRRILGEPENQRRATFSWLVVPALTGAVAFFLVQGGFSSVLATVPASEEALAPIVETVGQEPSEAVPSPEPVPAGLPAREAVEVRQVAPTVELPSSATGERAVRILQSEGPAVNTAVAPVLVQPVPQPVPAPLMRGVGGQQPPIPVVQQPQIPPEPPVPPSQAPRVVRTPFASINYIGGQPSSRIGVRVEDGPERGATVTDVTDNGPASAAGIEDGDLITAYNGTTVLGASQLSRLVSETPVGRTVALTYERNGQEQDVDVTVEEAQNTSFSFTGGVDGIGRSFTGIDYFDDATRSVRAWNDYAFFNNGQALGLQVQELTPDLRAFFGAEPDTGVIVASFAEESTGRDAGILVGDVIIAVDGNVVDSAADLRGLTSAVHGTGNSVTLTVIREGDEREIDVDPPDQD
jgi:beta-lactamase regulating signal transducer with metallopeptidase domain/membrane-associated protease RseP (regulator of RpoE activity)